MFDSILDFTFNFILFGFLLSELQGGRKGRVWEYFPPSCNGRGWGWSSQTRSSSVGVGVFPFRTVPTETGATSSHAVAFSKCDEEIGNVMEPFSKEGVHCDRLVYPREILIDQEMDLRIRFLFVFGISGSLCNLNSHSHQLQFFSFRVTDFQTMSLHRSVPHSAFFTYCSRQNLQSGHVPDRKSVV